MRHHLEDGAIADAEKRHGAAQCCQRKGERRQCSGHREAARGNYENRHEYSIAPKAVGEQPSDGTQEAPTQDDEGSQIAGGDSRKQILLMEEDGEESMLGLRHANRYSGSGLPASRLAPRLGQHAEEILEEVGYAAAERERILGREKLA